MIKKVFKLLSKETGGLHQAAFVLALFTFVAQLLGLTRDRLLAHLFGASSTLDVYYASFRIPDLILVTVASMVSISVLIPFLTEKLIKSTYNDKPDLLKARSFLNSIFTSFSIFIIIISSIIFFLIPELTKILFPGIKDPSQMKDLILLTRILLLSPIILGTSNLISSIVQVSKHFFIYALAPVFYNIGIIIGILFLYPIFGIKGLAFGAVLGAIFHLVVQLPSIIKTKIIPRITFNINFYEVKRVFFTSIPRILTLSTGQIAILFLISLASLMSEGSITVFNFSTNLQSVPLALIGVSYSIAAFSSLSRMFTENNMNDFKKHVESAMRHIIFWSLPTLVLFIVLRAQIVRTVLGSGQFDWSDTRLTAAALSMFVVSALAQGLVLLFIRVYYSAGNTKKPLIINTISALSIVGLSYFLVDVFNSNYFFRFFIESLFRIENIDGASVIMLPLAYSLGFILNAIIFWISFKSDFGKFSKNVSRTFFQNISSSIIVGFIAYKFLGVFNGIFDINTFAGIFLQGMSAGIVGVVSGIMVLKIMDNKEIEEIWKSIKTKINVV